MVYYNHVWKGCIYRIAIVTLLLLLVFISVQTVSASNAIFFEPPTPPNGATINKNYTFINTTVSNYSTAFMDWNRSLAGWWRFNGESGESASLFRDWSSWGNNGTCSWPNCAASTSGKFGSALKFDGVDDYFTVSNSTSLNPSNITLEIWFNATSGGLAGQKPLIHKAYTTNADPYYQYMLSLADTFTSPKSADFYLTIDGVLRWVEIHNLSYNYGQWHYLAGTYNGSTMTMYLDGEVVGTTPIVGAITPYNTPVEFGAYTNLPKNPDNIFYGKLDEARIHTRALSADEIKASYNVGINRLFRNFTNLMYGVYNYRAYGQKLSGNVNQTEMRSLNLIYDITPPAGVTDLRNISFGMNYINFTWINPPDPDYHHVMLFINGTFLTNITGPQNYRNVTGLTPDTEYELGTHTVDRFENINQTWVNKTARTAGVLNTPPVADCGPDKLQCENTGTKVQFNGTASYDPVGSISSYTWEFGDGGIGSGAAPNHTYAAYRWNGTAYEPYLVNLTVTDSGSLTNSTSQNVTLWIAGDANGDGKVDILDASVVGLKWNGNDPCADLNNDGSVNILDASIIGLNWGRSAIIGG